MADTMYCPFCGYKVEGQQMDYQIMLHIETIHPEGPSPFVPTEDLTGDLFPDEKGADQAEYVECAMPGCGEAVMLTELETHLMLHEFEDESDGHASKKLKVSELEATRTTQLELSDVTNGSSSGVVVSRDVATKDQWSKILNMPKSAPHKSPYRRLGKSELGPYAHENQMPAWLVKLLESDGEKKAMNRIGADGKLKKVMASENWASGIIPVITQLLEQDLKTEYAYICQPDVLHISKLKREGGFCGYRNIQMLVSNMLALKIPGHQLFDRKIPSIFQIQDHIEKAWDEGFNATGREETGGIKGTRKYIGTPDAQAMLLSLGISCQAQAYKTSPNMSAQELLFTAVEKYFATGHARTNNRKIRQTQLPSIYFQHPGHSMTIIGIEKKTSGAVNLLVFDPMFHDNEKITKHVGQKYQFKMPADLLRAYRRGSAYLKKYREFETLRYSGSSSMIGTDVTAAYAAQNHKLPPQYILSMSEGPPNHRYIQKYDNLVPAPLSLVFQHGGTEGIEHYERLGVALANCNGLYVHVITNQDYEMMNDLRR